MATPFTRRVIALASHSFQSDNTTYLVIYVGYIYTAWTGRVSSAPIRSPSRAQLTVYAIMYLSSLSQTPVSSSEKYEIVPLKYGILSLGCTRSHNESA